MGLQQYTPIFPYWLKRKVVFTFLWEVWKLEPRTKKKIRGPAVVRPGSVGVFVGLRARAAGAPPLVGGV